MAVTRRRGGFSVLEVLIGLTIGLIIWATIMTMMRAEARVREDVDARLSDENVPAVLHRHLSRDLSRVPLIPGDQAIKLDDGGRVLELTVQVAPAQLEARRLDLPVRTVRYRMTGRGTVVREEAGQRDVLPIEGLASLDFRRDAAVEEGAQDMLRVMGAMESRTGVARPPWTLSFPAGARKPGKVRWSSLIRGEKL